LTEDTTTPADMTEPHRIALALVRAIHHEDEQGVLDLLGMTPATLAGNVLAAVASMVPDAHATDPAQPFDAFLDERLRVLDEAERRLGDGE